MLKDATQYTLANASLVEDNDDKIKTSSLALETQAQTQRDEFLVEQLSKAKSENLQHELKIINLQNDLFRLQTKHKEFSKEKTTLLAHIEQLRQEKTKTESEIEQINQQRLAQEHSFNELKQEILNLEIRVRESQQDKAQTRSELQKVLSVAKQKEQFLINKIEDLNQQEANEAKLKQIITEKEAQVSTLSAEVNKLNQTIQNLANHDGNKGQVIERYRTERTKYEIALSNTKKDLLGLINELEKADTVKINLEKTVERSNIEMANLRQEINSLKATLGQVRETNVRLDTDHKNLTKQLDKSENDLDDLKHAYAILLEESKKTSLLRTVESEKFVTAKNQLEASLKVSYVKIEDLEEKLTRTTQQCESLESQKIKLMNDLSKKSYDLNDLRSTHSELVAEYNDYRAISTAEIEKNKNSMSLRESQLTHIFQTAEADYQTAQQNVTSLRRQLAETETTKLEVESRLCGKIEELHQTTADQAKQITDLKKELEDKKSNYNKFTNFFETEREKTNKVLSQLILEIKHSIALHPLKDYLQATEVELSRKELELKKLPYDAVNRKFVERQLEQLFEQRNTTRDLIKATEKHLLAQDTKAHHLMSYVDSLQVPKKL
jgi:chromosome segregation ATPase